MNVHTTLDILRRRPGLSCGAYSKTSLPIRFMLLIIIEFSPPRGVSGRSSLGVRHFESQNIQPQQQRSAT